MLIDSGTYINEIAKEVYENSSPDKSEWGQDSIIYFRLKSFPSKGIYVNVSDEEENLSDLSQLSKSTHATLDEDLENEFSMWRKASNEAFWNFESSLEG